MGSGSFDEIGSRRVRVEWFSCLVLTSQVIGVVAIILLAILFGQYRGGFAWTVSSLSLSRFSSKYDCLLQSDIAKEFNYHPLFMTLGMIFFYGDGEFVASSSSSIGH